MKYLIKKYYFLRLNIPMIIMILTYFSRKLIQVQMEKYFYVKI